MASEKAERTLKELGLTEYETRAYMGLVSSGPITARELSEKANVPSSRIYDILSKLEKKGWIESQSSRPARYRAKPPSEAMRLMRIKRDRKFKKARETILQELEPLYEKKAEMEKPEIWVIRGTQNLLGKVSEMFTNAEIEILITLPTLSQEISDLQEFIPLLEPKNLELRLLTSERNEIARNLESTQNVKVRYREPLFGGGIVIDSREALIVLESSGGKVGIWSDEIGLAKFAKEYFEYLWKESGGE
ncbi:MAG: TrmB family transcriptional regulator [Hadesarchaea archaeon]|nr:TrmB family transcriptional regulator [Hadesarchaea archaeon]